MKQQLLRTRPGQVHQQLQIFIVIQFAPLFAILIRFVEAVRHLQQRAGAQQAEAVFHQQTVNLYHYIAHRLNAEKLTR